MFILLDGLGSRHMTTGRQRNWELGIGNWELGVRHLNSRIRFMISCQARMLSFFVKTTPMLTARCTGRTRTSRST